MRILATFLVFTFFVPFVNGQKLKNIEAIELNTKFTLELSSNGSNNYSYKIISNEPFIGEIKSNSVPNFFDENLKTDQIQGILAVGTLGSQRSVQLIMKSGNEFPLQYQLFIDVKGKSKFKKTSAIPLTAGIPATEIWTQNVHSIKISSFQKAQIVSDMEIILDTACYSAINIDQGNLLLTKQLNMAIDLITSSDENDKESVEEFESIFESELQPDEWGWFQHQIKKSRSPDIYEKVECPYFERDAAYYYTKRKDLKLMTLSWGPRWSGGWQPSITKDLLSEFRTKYKVLLESVNTTLGAPIENSHNEDFTKFTARWLTSNGLKANASLSLGKYSYLLRFYVYKEE